MGRCHGPPTSEADQDTGLTQQHRHEWVRWFTRLIVPTPSGFVSLPTVPIGGPCAGGREGRRAADDLHGMMLVCRLAGYGAAGQGGDGEAAGW